MITTVLPLLGQKPFKAYDPAKVYLYPEKSSGDRWLVVASKGDFHLLTLLQAKERLGRTRAARVESEDYVEQMHHLGEEIIARERYLDSLLPRP